MGETNVQLTMATELDTQNNLIGQLDEQLGKTESMLSFHLAPSTPTPQEGDTACEPAPAAPPAVEKMRNHNRRLEKIISAVKEVQNRIV